jgi:hypothetical protein
VLEVLQVHSVSTKTSANYYLSLSKAPGDGLFSVVRPMSPFMHYILFNITYFNYSLLISMNTMPEHCVSNVKLVFECVDIKLAFNLCSLVHDFLLQRFWCY